MNIDAIGDNIERLLSETGKTKAQLSRHLGVTNTRVIHIVQGVSQPTAYQLYQMAKFFDCTMEDLMDGIEDEDPTRRFH